MKKINYFLQGFGYKDTSDFKHSVFKLLVAGDGTSWSILSMCGGLITYITGLQVEVFFAFVILIFLEFWTGVKVSRKVKKEKFKSRKMGRMFMKLGVYILLVSLLNLFAKQLDAPDILGVSLNPFTWLYYSVFVGLVFQMIISYLENLSSLGYAQMDNIIGMLFRKMNTIFEMDGSKNNDEIEEDISNHKT